MQRHRTRRPRETLCRTVPAASSGALCRTRQKFLEVVGVGLITCVEVGLVKRVHTLFGRNAQVVYELQVGEEVEGVRQEVREVKGEEKGEINVEGEPHTS